MVKFYQVVLAIILCLAFISFYTDCTGSNDKVIKDIMSRFSVDSIS